MATLRMPDRDLCADLRNDADPALAQYEDKCIVCSATNAQLRLYVAAWMLWSGTDTRAERDRALSDAAALYVNRGSDLLNRPGRLTTQNIVAEVLSLAEYGQEGDL